MPDPFGFLNIDKPEGITSHTVVAKIRRGLKVKKVGHAGTLDPMATGVLVICLGQATRLSEYAMSSTKTYRATLCFGAVTDTYDADGTITATMPYEHITLDALNTILSQFTGNIKQQPPMYSAIKQGGKKLYELAREGKSVERKSRSVRIDSIQVFEWRLPEVVIDVTCGAGTYIRSLAYDIGEALDSGAHLTGLVRLSSGAFQLEDSHKLDDLLEDDAWQGKIQPADTVLGDFPAIALDAEDTDHIKYGRPIEYDNGSEDHDIYRAYTSDGQLLALLKSSGSRLRPHKVFLSS